MLQASALSQGQKSSSRHQIKLLVAFYWETFNDRASDFLYHTDMCIRILSPGEYDLFHQRSSKGLSWLPERQRPGRLWEGKEFPKTQSIPLSRWKYLATTIGTEIINKHRQGIEDISIPNHHPVIMLWQVLLGALKKIRMHANVRDSELLDCWAVLILLSLCLNIWFTQ